MGIPRNRNDEVLFLLRWVCFYPISDLLMEGQDKKGLCDSSQYHKTDHRGWRAEPDADRYLCHHPEDHKSIGVIFLN